MHRGSGKSGRNTVKRLISGVLSLAIILTAFQMFPVRVMADVPGTVEKKLENLITQYNGKYWTQDGGPSDSSGKSSNYYYGIQCAGFAKFIFNELFGTGNIGAYDADKYYYPGACGAVCMGRAWNVDADDTETVKSILSIGRPGDLIQVRRRGKTYGHTMILVDVDDKGITVFDCNTDWKCGVSVHYQKFEDFAAGSIGMSLYHSSVYPEDGECSESYAGDYMVDTKSSPLNVRSGHGTDYGVIGQIPKGTRVYVSKADGNWAHVDYNGTKGYVSMDYLTRIPPEKAGLRIWLSESPAKEEYSGGLKTGDNVYICFELVDFYTGEKYNIKDDTRYEASVTVTGTEKEGSLHKTLCEAGNGYFDYVLEEAGKITIKVTITGEIEASSELVCDVQLTTDYCTHEFDDWTVKEPAGPDKDGIEERTCKICGATEMRSYKFYFGTGCVKLTGITACDDGLTVSWEELPYSDGYIVYRRDGQSDWIKMTVISSGHMTEYTDTTVISGRKYEYTVQAFRDKTVSRYDEEGIPGIFDAGWKKDNVGWWYKNVSGTYPMSSWKLIKGVWYYFDSTGYMVTGWEKIDGIWYYFDENGAMLSDCWKLWHGEWYYFDKTGAMEADRWNRWGGKWYYLGETGAMKADSWKLWNGKWYYLDETGAMKTDSWKLWDDKWYYLDENGMMKTDEWKLWQGKWYFLEKDGTMAENRLVGDYYVGADGAWVM